jgi:two-component system sensor histidine kinase KdpD
VGVAVRRDRLAAEATAAEVSRQSEAVKSALLESVSHDLRTPLAAIRAAAGSLMDPHVELSVEDRRVSAAAIDREAEHLNRLVTNLLDLSRIEAGGLRAEPEAIDLQDMVERSVERLSSRLGGRPVTIALDDAWPVIADPVFLDQVVTNILENAAKYTPPTAPIRIGARLVPDPPRVRLTIEDGGPGVPVESLDRLFEKFYRVPRRGEGSRPGTGIGLAVVQGLVDSMGGSVVARVGELGGLAVDVELPAVPPPMDAVRAAAAPVEPGQPASA